MKLFGYTIHKTPLYDLAEINEFKRNLNAEEENLKQTEMANPLYKTNAEIVHVMREVYLRMLEKM